MAYEISYIDESDTVVLRYQGETNAAEHIEGRCKVIRMCREKDTTRALVILGNINLHESLTKPELKLIADSIDKDLAANIVFAVVLPDSILSQNEVYFPIYIMKNKGINVMTFYNEEDAMKWLPNP